MVGVNISLLSLLAAHRTAPRFNKVPAQASLVDFIAGGYLSPIPRMRSSAVCGMSSMPLTVMLPQFIGMLFTIAPTVFSPLVSVSMRPRLLILSPIPCHLVCIISHQTSMQTKSPLVKPWPAVASQTRVFSCRRVGVAPCSIQSGVSFAAAVQPPVPLSLSRSVGPAPSSSK